MNREDLQRLAEIRVREAKVLLDNSCFPGAYYLSGYAVECALKACIAKDTKEFEFPDLKKVRDSYTHDLGQLVAAAGLRRELETQLSLDPVFQLNWTIVRDWNEAKRYEYRVTEHEAQTLYSAVSAKQNGVLEWLKRLW